MHISSTGSDEMKVLITGGAGYIGSAVAWACLDAGMQPVILDNLETGRFELVPGQAVFYQGDIEDGEYVDQIFAANPGIEATVHCAALTGIPESVASPGRYYEVNVAGTLALAGHLQRNGCARLVFSSSASVYAGSWGGGVKEDAPLGPASPYARTKAAGEAMLADLSAAGGPQVLSLRYFNPVGADPDMRTGPQGYPASVLGAMMLAHDRGGPFTVTGTTWPTRDGSGVRDYIHVWDLATAHVAALTWFGALPGPAAAVNLGTGTGTTVLELLTAFERVAGRLPEVRTAGPRQGDTAGGYAITDLAEQLLGWRPRYSLEDAIQHALQWSKAVVLREDLRQLPL